MHERYFRAALAQARDAEVAGEVPVGAVVVHEGQVIATGANCCITASDPSAHAEIVALRKAGQYLGNYRLQDCDVYTTLEPCVMCAGALVQARVRHVYYGAFDLRAGAAGSAINLFAHGTLNHHSQAWAAPHLPNMEIALVEEMQAILPNFFRHQRTVKRHKNRWPLRPDALRTPDNCFFGLDYIWPSYYIDHLTLLAGLRMHFIDVLPMTMTAHAPSYLCLHHSPYWGYAFRDFVGQQSRNDTRVLVPDLIGFGKSDKPKRSYSYTENWHADVLAQWLMHMAEHAALRLETVQIVVQTQAHPLLPHLVEKIPVFKDVPILQVPITQSGVAYSMPYPDRGHQALLKSCL